MKLSHIALAVSVTWALGGCASTLRGTKTDFTVETTPAGAQVQLSTGQTCAATPCTFHLPRKYPFVATVSKDGYEPQQVQIRNPWSRRGTTTGIIGNAILGGGIGIGVDAMTGANRDFVPNPLQVTLVPIPAPEPAVAPEPAPESAAAPEPALETAPTP